MSVLGHDALDESGQTSPDNAMAVQGRGRKRLAQGNTHLDKEASLQVLLLPFCEASDWARTEICNAAYDGVVSKAGKIVPDQPSKDLPELKVNL